MNAIWDKIDREINSGCYETEVVNGELVQKCNLFADSVSRRFWGVGFPKIKDSSDLNNRYGKDWGDRPMLAAWADGYYENRSLLPNSGVRKIDRFSGNKIANEGGLVLALGRGHATIMAPGEYPSVFRPSIKGRSDKRTRVGAGDGLKYYYIDPKQYKKYNNWLEANGFSQRDIHEKYFEKGQDYEENEKYMFLHKDRLAKEAAEARARLKAEIQMAILKRNQYVSGARGL